MTLTIRAARPEEAELVLGLHQEAVAWLAARGHDQWQPQPEGRQTADRVRRAIVESIRRQECFLAFDGADAVATITVDSKADPEFWTDRDRPDDALYVHRMIVKRSHAGRGIGEQLLEFARNLAAKAGRTWLRLDAWATNAALHNYYRSLGFEHVRTLNYSHRGSGALFQTPAGGYRAAESTRPEPPPVVAAIVTSDRGVLIARRNDGEPPWTFIAGEIGPGESPADAAVREVKEETGLRVRAAEREIGRRVHPRTGRTMIYLACYPIGKADPFVGDPVELAEVRWVSLDEADRLLSGMFGPVRSHLTHELG